MIVKRAEGHGGMRRWYDRSRRSNIRYYHVIGLSRVVCAEGSGWRLTIFSWTCAFGLRGSRKPR